MLPFDFIVIGGGTFGAAVAEHLWFRATGRSERILVLEAGPFLLPGHTQNFPSLGVGREVWGVSWNSDPALAYLPNAGLAFCIGGRSLWWGGWSPRLLDAETATWPAAVLNDLNAPTLPNGDNGYFRQAGQQIGVTATNDYIFGHLHVALRQQLYNGVTVGNVTGAIALDQLPAAAPVEILPPPPDPPTPATLAELAAMLGEALPDPLPAGAAARTALANELREPTEVGSAPRGPGSP